MSAVSNAVMRAIAGMARRRAQRMALQDLMGLAPAILDDLRTDPFTLAAGGHRSTDRAGLSPSAAGYGFEDELDRYQAPTRTNA